MPTDPTPEEIARTKKWAAMQVPLLTPVFDEERSKWYWMPPVRPTDGNESPYVDDWLWDFMSLPVGHDTQGQCWAELALRLRRPFASIRPAIESELTERCANIALAIDSGRGNEKEIAAAIRAMK